MMSLKNISNEVKKLPDLNEMTRCLYHYKYKELLKIKKFDDELLNYVFYSEKRYKYDVTINKEIRKDYKFKKEVIYRYDSQCIISGNDMDMCDVAHIVPFRDPNEYERYDPYNGLILSKELHGLFDKKLLKINPDTLTIEISPEKLQNKKNNCNKYHNTIINIKLNDKTINYLRRCYTYS